MGKFNLEKVLWAVEKYRVTHLCVVPPVMVELVKQSAVMKRYDLSSLKQVRSGAAPLGRDVVEECARNIPRVDICQVIIYYNSLFFLFFVFIFWFNIKVSDLMCLSFLLFCFSLSGRIV